MKAYRVLAVTAILAMLCALAGRPEAASARSVRPDVPQNALYVPGQVIVGFRDALSQEAAGAQAEVLAGEVGGQVEKVAGNVSLLQFDESTDVQRVAAQLRSLQGVAYAEPNYVRWIPELRMDRTKVVGSPKERTEVTFRLRDVSGKKTREIKLSLDQLRSMKSIRNGKAVPTWPTDPAVWTQWGWDATDASLVWTDKSPNPAVCVVDTGVDRGHPDLKVLPGYDFVNDDADPADDNGHGTHVAGIISAVVNNKKGLAGISTAGIVPVKVLSAQGWGTAFDIAQGITYCANRTDVKIINLSLGGYRASLTEYNALDYAINTKGKLVVAAAGNDSMAYLDNNEDNDITAGSADTPAAFPAGWAVSWVCKDGTLAPGAPATANCSSGNGNGIAHGLISVAAANSAFDFWFDNNQDGLVWVDVNGDGHEPGPGDSDYWDEHFRPDECSTEFSNYGAWVEIMAPGKDIYSTVPVSYNYWSKYFWGADPDGNGYDSWSGTSMAAPHVAGAAARVWSVFPGQSNSQIESRLAHSGISMWWPSYASDPFIARPWEGYYGGEYAGEAPFCWPDATHGPLYDMSGVPYLDVAGAMDRTGLWQPVWEAVTGLPLEGATVMAYSGGILRDKAAVSRRSAWTTLINLPASMNYTIRVNKAGYTSGAVDAYPGLTFSCWPGWEGCAVGGLAIPPMGRITAVASWWWGDLDLYAWLPTVSSLGGVVGAGLSGSSKDLGPGLLSDFPRARWNRDGGAGDWLGTESISIVPRPGLPNVPYYNQTPGDRYHFLVTDYGSRDLSSNWVSFRLWAGGNIVPGSFLDTLLFCDTDAGENWWYIGYIQGGTFTPVNQCGPDSVRPYSSSGSNVIQGTQGESGGK